MREYQVGIIGGGAAGIVAAISAGKKGLSCIILEKMPRLGKKILVSGNGRCNLLNEDLGEANYNPAARPMVKSVFSRFGASHIKRFFKELGLEIYFDRGRAFPVTNQASSVLRVLEIEVERLSIPVIPNFEATAILKKKQVFEVVSGSGNRVVCDTVVMASGGKSYPALGSDGGMFKLLKSLGHEIVEPVPVAVPLVIKNPLCHILQGQKIYARTSCSIGGKKACEASGDVLFTKYGLSGTAILDISEPVSIAINRRGMRDVLVLVDLVPFMNMDEMIAELTSRQSRGVVRKNLIAGILPNKFADALNDILGKKDVRAVAAELKNMVFKVSGTRGWNEADFTAGGVNISDISHSTLESKLEKGLFFAGEVVDVNGKRGGYNLAWAWASGYIAGMIGAN